MKLFAATLATETNTFASTPTGLRAYEEHGVYYGDATVRDPRGSGSVLALWKSLALADGFVFHEGLCAGAQPSGKTVRSVYEGFRDSIVEAVESCSPDVVLLGLHGAMVADGYDDCEGDLLSRVRAAAGSRCVVAAELDLHCHLSTDMVRHADALIAFKEYPHTDVDDRARELYQLAIRAWRGEVKPVTAAADCNMTSLFYTTEEPMRSFVARMKSLETGPVLSVSFGHGFPWGDVVDAGAKVWVICDGDMVQAQALAATLRDEIWSMRHETRPAFLSIDEAIDRVEGATAQPYVLADVADNAGGGAPSDSTFVLKRLLERGIGDVACAVYWDPGAVAMCLEAGEGATLDIRVGGKCGPASGDPIDLHGARVAGIRENATQEGLGRRWPLGTTVLIEAARGVHVVLSTVRSQVFSPSVFTDFGLDLSRKRAIVVKSTQHFYAGFEPVASGVLYISAPGAISPAFESIPYQKRSLEYWPRVEGGGQITEISRISSKY